MFSRWFTFHKQQEEHLYTEEEHKVDNLSQYYLMEERLVEAIELRARVL